MTNKERIISLLGFAPSTNSVEGALIDEGLTVSDTYLLSNAVPLKTAALKLMRILITTPDTVNENGYAIKYDRPSMLKYISNLEDELGLTAEPTITSRVVW